jgi:DNA-directed RNA polymerase specialized sigma subunit
MKRGRGRPRRKKYQWKSTRKKRVITEEEKEKLRIANILQPNWKRRRLIKSLYYQGLSNKELSDITGVSSAAIVRLLNKLEGISTYEMMELEQEQQKVREEYEKNN